MKLTIILKNAVTALQMLHIRGDEAKLFSGAIDALNSVISALEQAEKEIAAQPITNNKEESE